MLVTFSALIVSAMPALFQGVPTPDAATAAAPVHSSLTSRDSVRVQRLARRVQGDFETQRRRFLPYEMLDGGGGCGTAFGRYCYQPQYATPPREAPQIVVARTRLLEMLDSLSAMVPGDRWILGQRVRYLMEAGRPLLADSMAVVCAARSEVPATSSWCFALAGYVAQQLGNYPRADAAFASA